MYFENDGKAEDINMCFANMYTANITSGIRMQVKTVQYLLHSVTCKLDSSTVGLSNAVFSLHNGHPLNVKIAVIIVKLKTGHYEKLYFI